MAEVPVVCDVKNAQLRFAGVNETEDPVIRPDEKISAGLGDDRAARRPHAGINHHEVYRPGGKIVVTRAERERGRLNVMSRHVVRDVDDLGLRVDSEDDAFYCWNEVVAEAEIGEKGDHKSSGQWIVGSSAHYPLPTAHYPLFPSLLSARAPRCGSGFLFPARELRFFRPGPRPSRRRRR